MATSPRSNTELYSSKGDLISELPADVKERILELLSTRDAARTALLSTHWNHVWLRHGRLVFDTNFFQCVSSKGKAEKVIALVNIINNILLLRDEPIKKFTLHMNETDLKPQQSDLDRWCRFLSRNGVQELTLLAVWGEYKLPSCIVSCRTIKQLILDGFILDLPINARCIFPGVTSLVFNGVEFDAARTALLSTHWNHVWLRYGRLVFDTDFFQCVSSKGKADKVITLVNIINNILLLRDGPIKKFAVHMNETDLKPQQSDLDRWCRFLSRNGVQELTLLAVWGEYKLPSCVVSCRTIKQLILYGFILDLPINARCIFPGVTSLVFNGVELAVTINKRPAKNCIPFTLKM
nr:F-box/FBD/LRR-repeat protein At1g13570-like [Ipomoea batatas]